MKNNNKLTLKALKAELELLKKGKTSKDSRGGSNLLPYTRRQGG
jgi:hypothetical protein